MGSSDNPELCPRCGGAMARVSPSDTSPLILECGECGHRTFAEIQIPPPWPPVDSKPKERPKRTDKPNARATISLRGGAPATVGKPGEEGTVIPFGCVILPFLAVVLVALAWLLLL